MSSSEKRGGVAGRGTLARGALVARYDISHPAPTQWIAVGVVTTADDGFAARRPHRMVVGSGRTEAAAVEALAVRLAELGPEFGKIAPEPCLPIPTSPTDLAAVETPGWL